MFHLHLNVEPFVKTDCVCSYIPGGDYKCFLLFLISPDTQVFFVILLKIWGRELR